MLLSKSRPMNTKATTLLSTINKQTIPLHRSTSPPPPPNRKKTIVQVHEEFKNVRIDDILNIIKPIVSKSDDFYTSMDKRTFSNYIYNKFSVFIRDQNVASNEDIMKGLVYTLKKVFYCDINPIQKIQIGNIVDYTFTLPSEIIMDYITIFIDDNTTALKGISENTDNILVNLSCTRGIRERFFTSLKDALIIYCSNISNCIPLYQRILSEGFNVNIDNFKQLDKNEITREWKEKYLDDTTFVNNLNDISEEERENFLKEHYINYMLTEYKNQNQETPENTNMILNEAEELSKFGVFKNMVFGGKKRNKHKKRNTYKKKNRVKKRNTYKKRNRVKKRNK